MCSLTPLISTLAQTRCSPFFRCLERCGAHGVEQQCHPGRTAYPAVGWHSAWSHLPIGITCLRLMKRGPRVPSFLNRNSLYAIIYILRDLDAGILDDFLYDFHSFLHSFDGTMKLAARYSQLAFSSFITSSHSLSGSGSTANQFDLPMHFDTISLNPRSDSITIRHVLNGYISHQAFLSDASDTSGSILDNNTTRSRAISCADLPL